MTGVWRAAVPALVMALLTLGCVGVVGWFGVLALQAGTLAGVALGVCCLVLAAVGVWAVGAETWFGVRSARLLLVFDDTHARPTDGLSRSISGRVDPAAARAALDDLGAMPGPDAAWGDLLSWALLADAAGERSQARRATVRALKAYRGEGR